MLSALLAVLFHAAVLAEPDPCQLAFREALEELYELDQSGRSGAGPINDLWNQGRLDELVEQCGWPDVNVVGERAALGGFLVLQHAPLEMQVRYLPKLREAEKSGFLVPGTLPYLEDRVLIRQGFLQIYGTQFGLDCQILEIQEPDRVEALRAEAGLGSLDDYRALCLENRPDSSLE